VTIAMSACTILFLVVSKECINPRIKRHVKVGIPFDIIVVIIATLVSYLLGLHVKYNVSIVESIPTGLPAPRLPNWSIMPALLVDSISIAIVGFVLSFSVSKLFAKRFGYRIDAAQEPYAYGTCGKCAHTPHL
jgi:MFS superfamily sulfate permease-like transporter